MEKQKNAVGRRKEAVTRVFVVRGDGAITVNDLDYKAYFPQIYLQQQVEQRVSSPSRSTPAAAARRDKPRQPSWALPACWSR